MGILKIRHFILKLILSKESFRTAVRDDYNTVVTAVYYNSGFEELMSYLKHTLTTHHQLRDAQKNKLGEREHILLNKTKHVDGSFSESKVTIKYNMDESMLERCLYSE